MDPPHYTTLLSSPPPLFQHQTKQNMLTHPTFVGKKTASVVSPPTIVEHGSCRFLITDQPNDRNLSSYISSLKENKSARLCRACDNNTYDANALRDVGIQCFDLEFDDGAPPPVHVLTKWLDLIEQWFVDNDCFDRGWDGALGSCSICAFPKKRSIV